MSQSYPQYPLSNFPEQLDIFTRMQDITTDDVFLIKQYQGYINANDIASAQNLLQENPTLESKIFNAEKFNQITDALQSQQKFFRDNVAEYIITWQNILSNDIKEFSYKGVYSNITPYKEKNYVQYTSESGTHVYIAIKDNSGKLPTDPVYWQKLTMQGENGADGMDAVGFAFMGSWNDYTAYTKDQAVQFGNKLFCALQGSTNIPPSLTGDTTYWAKVWDFSTISQSQKQVVALSVTGNTVAIPSELLFDKTSDDLQVTAGGSVLIEGIDYTINTGGTAIVKVSGSWTAPLNFEFKSVKNSLIGGNIDALTVKDGSITEIKLATEVVNKLNQIGTLNTAVSSLVSNSATKSELSAVNGAVLALEDDIAQLQELQSNSATKADVNSINSLLSTLQGDIVDIDSALEGKASINDLSSVSTIANSAYNSVGALNSDFITRTSYCVATGTANNYAVVISGLSALLEGTSLAIKINATNTSSSTVNVNGLGAKYIKHSNGENVVAGDLLQHSIYTVRYNGSNFILQARKEVQIQNQPPTDCGTAVSEDIVSGKTFMTPDGMSTGTMPANTNFMRTINDQSGIINIPRGYHDGNGRVTANITNLIAGNIIEGATVGGIVGTGANGTPTTFGSAGATDVLSGKTLLTSNGILNGTMANNGAYAIKLTKVNTATKIPAGYHNGNGYAIAEIANLSASNIREGVNIGGVTGTLKTDTGLKMVTGTFTTNSGYNDLGWGICGATFKPSIPFKPKMVVVRPDSDDKKILEQYGWHYIQNLVLFWTDGSESPYNTYRDSYTEIGFADGVGYDKVGIKFSDGYAPNERTDGYWKVLMYTTSGGFPATSLKWRYWAMG